MKGTQILKAISMRTIFKNSYLTTNKITVERKLFDFYTFPFVLLVALHYIRRMWIYDGFME